MKPVCVLPGDDSETCYVYYQVMTVKPVCVLPGDDSETCLCITRL